MFCPKCGMKNEDGTKFCSACGAKLTEESVQGSAQETVQETVENPEVSQVQEASAAQQVPPVQQPVPPVQQQYGMPLPKKPVNKLMIATIVEAVVLMLVIVCFFAVGKKTYGIEQTAENFFLSYMNGNWDECYEQLDVNDSTFISKEKFIEANTNVGAVEYNAYQVDEEYSNKLQASVRVSYSLKSSGTKRYMYITLNKQKGKKFLFFNSWKATTDTIVANDVYVYVPHGAVVTIDGIELAPFLYSSEEYEDTYVIPQIFVGTHRVAVTDGDFKYEDDYYVESYGSIGVYSGDMKVDPELEKAIADRAYEAFTTCLNAGMQGADFDTVSSLFEYPRDVKDSYEWWAESTFFTEDESYSYYDRYYDITMKNIEVKDVQIWKNSDGDTYASATVVYEYEGKQLSRYWSDDPYQECENEGYNEEYYSFILKDGQWLMEYATFPLW